MLDVRRKTHVDGIYQFQKARNVNKLHQNKIEIFEFQFGSNSVQSMQKLSLKVLQFNLKALKNR